MHVFTTHITLLNAGCTEGIATHLTSEIESGLGCIVNTIDGQVHLGSIGKGRSIRERAIRLQLQHLFLAAAQQRKQYCEDR